jgi:filamentous hemagglutinin
MGVTAETIFGTTMFAKITEAGTATGVALTPVGHAAAAAAGGFAAGGIQGGNIESALQGALTGAVSGAVSGAFGDAWSVGRVAAQTATSAVVAQATGGDPRRAALTSLGFALLQYGNSAMRDAQIESSNRFPGIFSEDGELRVANNTGLAGNGTGFFSMKLAGSRNLLAVCGEKASCEFNEDGSVLYLGSARQLRESLDALGPQSPFGGVQGYTGMFAGSPYAPNDFISRIAEAFAPSHDSFNAPYWYDRWGNVIGHSGFAAHFGEALSMFNLLPAAPFALSTFVPAGTPDILGTRKRD